MTGDVNGDTRITSLASLGCSSFDDSKVGGGGPAFAFVEITMTKNSSDQSGNSNASRQPKSWEEHMFEKYYPPGHPHREKMRMFLQGMAMVQRENGLTPEGLEPDYRRMDAEKAAKQTKQSPTSPNRRD
jgi:hypothetical protein